MLRASLKGVWAHKLRLALTGIIIVAGVGLVSGVYVYTDTISRAFDDIFADAFEGVDIIVSAESEFAFSDRTFMDEAEVNALADVEGVEGVFPSLGGVGLQILDKEGEVLGPVPGPPTFLQSISDQDQGGFLISEGSHPVGNQMALDRITFEDAGYALGDTVTIVSDADGLAELELVGVASFGQDDDLGGAKFVLTDLLTTQTLLGRPGAVSGAAIQVEPGADVADVISRIEPLLAENTSVLDGQSAAEAQAAEIQEGLSFLTIFLSIFGYTALFAGSLIIFNTFQIVVRQRTQELALMRALGASKGQVNRMVWIEALIMGLGGAIAGLIFGYFLAAGIRGLFESIGFELPTTSLVLLSRTIWVGLATGIGVTLAASIVPAWRASRVPVMAALREDAASGPESLARRILIGSVTSAIGFASMLYGLFGTIDGAISPIQYVGFGVPLVFIGVLILSPLVARPLAGLIGQPFQRLFGVTGQLARGNSMRSPRQTAATAVAVMVSITLVTLASILVASIRGTIDDIIGNDIQADVIVSSNNQFDPLAGFTPALADTLAADDDIESVTRVQFAAVFFGDAENFVAGSAESFTDAFPSTNLEGTLALQSGEIAIQSGVAEDEGLAIGDTVDLVFESTFPDAVSFTIAGIDESRGWPAPFIISTADLVEITGAEIDSALYVNAAGNLTEDELKSTVEALSADLPTVQAQTSTEVRDQAEAGLQTLLNIILGLLSVTVLIGILGVAITITLSVVERTREIGLLRAVGLDRPSTKKMVRYEAVIISVLGAVMGVGLGVLFGWTLVRALSDDGLSFAIQWLPNGFSVGGILGSLLFWVIMTGILGTLAAVYPAQRASNLNVLEAVAYE